MSINLYSTTGVESIRHGEKDYDADEHGVFSLPDHVAAELHPIHVGGQRAWEDENERVTRLEAERQARRRDPSTLLDAVEKLIAPSNPVAAAPSAEDLRAQATLLLAAADAAEEHETAHAETAAEKRKATAEARKAAADAKKAAAAAAKNK